MTSHTKTLDRKRAWVSEFLSAPMVDMVQLDSNFAGIYVPEAELGADRIGITDQFLANAEAYATTYGNSAHFSSLFRQAFLATAYQPDNDTKILDIGTGSGVNTIVPCLNLFPGCRIVATDLSPNLLRILRGYVTSQNLEDRVACVCTDAMNNYFVPGSFDVVVGAAILHHILDPLQTITAAYDALRSGGTTFFFEPFEGMALVRVAFTLILERSRREALALDANVARFLEAMIVDIKARTGTDKSDEKFRYMDDKWLFTRHYLENVGKRAHFATTAIIPHAFHESAIFEQVISLLRVGMGKTPAALPDWAWDMIRTFDTAFSAEMKRDLLLEGTIVFRKA